MLNLSTQITQRKSLSNTFFNVFNDYNIVLLDFYAATSKYKKFVAMKRKALDRNINTQLKITFSINGLKYFHGYLTLVIINII